MLTKDNNLTGWSVCGLGQLWHAMFYDVTWNTIIMQQVVYTYIK